MYVLYTCMYVVLRGRRAGEAGAVDAPAALHKERELPLGGAAAEHRHRALQQHGPTAAVECSRQWHDQHDSVLWERVPSVGLRPKRGLQSQ